MRYIPILVADVLVGCAADGGNLRLESLEKQISHPESRIEDMEAAQKAMRKTQAQPAPAPCVRTDTLRSPLISLRKKRAALLIKYTEKNPDVIELDRKIRLLQDQIKALDSTDPNCKPPPLTAQQ